MLRPSIIWRVQIITSSHLVMLLEHTGLQTQGSALTSVDDDEASALLCCCS